MTMKGTDFAKVSAEAVADHVFFFASVMNSFRISNIII